MSELSDLEICKRIAEIEGVPHKIDTNYLGEKSALLPNSYCEKNKCSFVYNPLTDDALCFKLMVKYELHLNIDHNTKCWSACDGRGHFENNQHDKSPNKAICLAIIEAHKDNKS